MKKIKQEDARIEMRKKTLAKNAERIAQARAKAAAAQAPPITEAPSSSQEVPMEPAKAEPLSAVPLAVSGSLIHPSLPPKPGTSVPARAPGTEGPSVAPAVAAPAPVPPVPVAMTPAPAPTADDQILKLEDVRVVFPRSRHLTDTFT